MISKIKKILSSDENIKKLKSNYNWSCLYPDEINNSFKFDTNDLEFIFNNYKFKNLTTKSKDHLILTSYINNIYGSQVVKTKTKAGHAKYYIDDEFKGYYIDIVENVKPLNTVEKLLIID